MWEQSKIADIQQYPAFAELDSGEEYDNDDSPFSKVPDWLEYKHKLICEFIANGDFSLYKRLYEETEASEVWDYLAIRRARGL